MSRWTEQYKAHPFHADWSRLLEVIAAPMPDDSDVAAAQEVARLKKVLEYVKGIVDNQDPEITHPNFLPGLHPYVQSATGEATNYFSNTSIGHLQNANAQADLLLAAAIQSPFVAFASTKAGLTKAAIHYAETMAKHAASYASTTQNLLAGTTNHVSELEAGIAAADAEVTKLDGRLATVETTVQSQLSTFNGTFQASETARTQSYDAWLAKHQEKTETHLIDMMRKNDVGLGILQDYQAQAEKVLGTVIDTAQAGAYAKYANEEKVSANRYRAWTIALMAAAAIVLFLPELTHAIKEASSYTVDWQKALARLPFSLILFAPALYLAKESNKHRANEVSNRRRQHILTTIGPYLALLDPTRAEEIKADVAKSIFSDNLPVADKSGEADSMANQVVRNLLAAVTRQGR